MLTSHFSRTDWWIAAFVAGSAAAVAFQTLILEKKNRWKAIVLPLGAALACVLSSAARGIEGDTPLQLYTVAMLGLALTRVVFARYLRRLMEQARSGQPVQPPKVWQSLLFVFTLMAIMLAIAVTV
ncbi:hypothetical protein [Streptomyces sp. NPDC127105]|uniref:hypothetical protein n=1 Tax=Streptomyces sp. NPDC127105 TaxID=3345359 RepID=UPI0036504A71